MATLFLPFSILFFSCSFASNESSRFSLDGILISFRSNCFEVHRNDSELGNIPKAYFCSSDGYPVNCNLCSINSTFVNLSVHQCKHISNSSVLLHFLNISRTCQLSLSCQGSKLDSNRSNHGVNCEEMNETNLTSVIAACDVSDSYYKCHLTPICSSESSKTAENIAEFVVHLDDHYDVRLKYDNASKGDMFMKIVILLILGVLFLILLFITIGLCMICKIKMTLRSHPNINRTLPKVSLDDASIATYASVKYPSRQHLTDYHEVNVLPSVSEVDENEVFDNLDDNDTQPEGKLNLNDQKNESSVSIVVDHKTDGGSSEIKRSKKPSVVYAFIKKTKATGN